MQYLVLNVLPMDRSVMVTRTGISGSLSGKRTALEIAWSELVENVDNMGRYGSSVK